MNHNSFDSTLHRIAFIGNYMPRQCGIAAFTTGLCEAIAAHYYLTMCIALAGGSIRAILKWLEQHKFKNLQLGDVSL